MGVIRAFRRLGAVRRALVLALIAAGLTVTVLGAGVAGAAIYGTYGYHPAENARSWAALTPRYGDPSQCAACHGKEYALWTKAKHVAVECESCHGPLSAHAANPASAPKVVSPTTDACLTCHQQVLGRPSDLPQVDLAIHYPGVTCLQCHNAHTSLAESPKEILHPLANLPACVTCHGRDGSHPFPAGHLSADDQVCLGCHKPAAKGQ